MSRTIGAARKLLLGGICILSGGAGAFADDWAPPSAGPIVTWTAPLVGKNTLVVQPFFFYNHTRGTFDSEGRYHSLDSGDRKEQYQEVLFLQYGVTDRLEIDAQMVFQHNFSKVGSNKAYDNGLGDSFLFVRYCAVEESSRFPHVTGVLQTKIPTGKYQNADPDELGADLNGAGTGGGSWDPGFGVILSKRLRPFMLHADMSYSVPQEVHVDQVRTLHGAYLNFNVGVEFFLENGFNLLLDMNGLNQRDRKESGNKVSASGVQSLILTPGVGWSNDKIQTLLGYQRVVDGKNTDANDSIVITAIFTF